MADESGSGYKKLIHVESPNLTTRHADGAILSSIQGSAAEPKIQITFYCEATRVKYEGLEPVEEVENGYRPVIEEDSTEPIREQLSRISMSVPAAQELLGLLKERLEDSDDNSNG